MTRRLDEGPKDLLPAPARGRSLSAARSQHRRHGTIRGPVCVRRVRCGSGYVFSTDPRCARVTGFRNWRVDWSVHLKLSIEKWLLVICPSRRPVSLISATPTAGPRRTNNQSSILNDQFSIGRLRLHRESPRAPGLVIERKLVKDCQLT